MRVNPRRPSGHPPHAHHAPTRTHPHAHPHAHPHVTRITPRDVTRAAGRSSSPRHQEKEKTMRVLVAGATGVIGRGLVPLLTGGGRRVKVWSGPCRDSPRPPRG